MLDSRINCFVVLLLSFNPSPPGPNAPINQLPNVAQPYRSLACWYHDTYGNRAIKCKGKPFPWSSPRDIEQKKRTLPSTN